MEYHLTLPVSPDLIKKLHIGDVLYITGDIFTARDEAHKTMLEKEKNNLPFDPSSMALYHCGPLMKKTPNGWEVVSAGPTTSGRMELFEDKFIEKFGVHIIIGKGGMGEKTKKALQRHSAVYTAYTGGAGALAAERIKNTQAVYWLEEFGMPEAVWIFTVKEFGPLIVAMDAFGKSIYRQLE
ncbi:MAG: fumarate hydratase [Thermoplasmata archaeon M11B2D]|nr:MAG: fumarate hydratase [Thermoplasmata archaeon M11B2D]PNX54205.1 MAG: fumarate hydratase [Thermoplasmata archaeon M9B2D]